MAQSLGAEQMTRIRASRDSTGREHAHASRSADLYIAHPRRKAVAAVVVLHAFWGLSEFFTGVCDRLAAEGFLAIAPDLFEGEKASTRAAAERMRRKKRRGPTYLKVERAAELASESMDGRPIGVIGFSYGGHWALWLAANQAVPVGAAVTFYASRTSDFHQTPIQAHFAERDEYVSKSGRQRFEKALPPGSSVFEYPRTGHWFFEENQRAYDAAAARVAWRRTVTFLRRRLA
jgi:carboxymethylenebutenolidase